MFMVDFTESVQPIHRADELPITYIVDIWADAYMVEYTIPETRSRMRMDSGKMSLKP